MVKKEELLYEIRPGASCEEIIFSLQKEYPLLAPILPHCLVAVNAAYAEKGMSLSDGDELAFLPPVSGG